MLVTVDTLRPDYMGINGYDRPTTPFLDSLLAGGFYFEEAVAPIARTTPALASLLTGAYPHRTGVRTLRDRLRDDVVPIAEILVEQGYQTMAVVTNWVLTPERRLDRGFEIYDTAHDSRTARETTDVALEFLESQDPARPSFTWVHYIDPHVPYHSDPSIVETFDPEYEGRYKNSFGSQPPPGASIDQFSAFPRDLSKQTAVHQNPLTDNVNRHVRRLYAADIRFTDDHLRRLVDAVRKLQAMDLLIVFAADHGESLGEHDYYFDHGDYVYNAGTRVPLAFILSESHPLHGSGQISGWVSLVDVVPTLLDLLGHDIPESSAGQIEGRSLVPALKGEQLPAAAVFAESGRSRFPSLVEKRVRNDLSGRFRSVILDDWKLIWTPFQTGESQWELYDLRSDPDETTDLYRADHSRVPALQHALEEWMISGATVPNRPTEMPPEDLEALRALGYVE